MEMLALEPERARSRPCLDYEVVRFIKVFAIICRIGIVKELLTAGSANESRHQTAAVTYSNLVVTGLWTLDALLALRYAPSRTQLGDLLAAVSAQGLTIRDISSQETDLEDIFLQLTRDAGKIQ